MSGAPHPTQGSLIDQASEYIEKLANQITQQRAEIERLELVVREQNAVINSMAGDLKREETAEDKDAADEQAERQKTIADLETIIEMMSLDLEARSNRIISLSAVVAQLKEHLSKIIASLTTTEQSTHVLDELRLMLAELSRIEEVIQGTTLPHMHTPSTSPAPDRSGRCVSESTVHLVPSYDKMGARVDAKGETSGSPPVLFPDNIVTDTNVHEGELQYYKKHCASLEQQIVTLRDALLSQEEMSRRVASSLPTTHQFTQPVSSRQPLLPFSRQNILLELLQIVNTEIQKSPRACLNNAFNQEFASCLKSVANGTSAASQPLPRFAEAFTLLMTSVSN